MKLTIINEIPPMLAWFANQLKEHEPLHLAPAGYIAPFDSLVEIFSVQSNLKIMKNDYGTFADTLCELLTHDTVGTEEIKVNPAAVELGLELWHKLLVHRKRVCLVEFMALMIERLDLVSHFSFAEDERGFVVTSDEEIVQRFGVRFHVDLLDLDRDADALGSDGL